METACEGEPEKHSKRTCDVQQNKLSTLQNQHPRQPPQRNTKPEGRSRCLHNEKLKAKQSVLPRKLSNKIQFTRFSKLVSLHTRTPPPNPSKLTPSTHTVQNSKLLTLPPEIHLRIFKHLDRCSSTCLGLTSEVLYPLHFSLRGKVPLRFSCALPQYNRVSSHGEFFD
jgi:hypothetical protein